jgi:ABC-type dipeptide/oligopeptide/nickel transport system ATPase subunit
VSICKYNIMCMDVYVIMNVVYIGCYLDNDVNLSLISVSHDVRIICAIMKNKRIL